MQIPLRRKLKSITQKRKYIYTQNITILKSTILNNATNTTTGKKVIKEGVINLTGKELCENKVRVLHLLPKFFPTCSRKQIYMDIIQVTDNCALELENDGYFKIKKEKNRTIATRCQQDTIEKQEASTQFKHLGRQNNLINKK